METLRVRSLECGFVGADLGTMLEGQIGHIRMPVAAFVVEHPNGTLVFDTGMHPELERTKDRMKGTAPRARIPSAVTRGKALLTNHSLLK